MENVILQYEQELAYEESVQIDMLKAISKQEQIAKLEIEIQEQQAAAEYEARLQAEKANKELIRAKRLKALSSVQK
jgi:hypothetical protein